MRITKVEGSLGLPCQSYQDDNEAEAERMDFEQLMHQALPIGENNPPAALNKNVVSRNVIVLVAVILTV